MIRGYDDVKALAAEIGCRAEDLLALAPGNDPFYSGVASRQEAGRWFADCWEKFGFGHGVHLRRTHYALISQVAPVLKPNGESYENTDNDWKFLDRASLAARYLGLIPADAFVDRRNPDPIINAKANGGDPRVTVLGSYPDFVDELPEDLPLPEYFVSGFEPRQEFLVEVWPEKSTVNDILEPLAQRLRFNLVAGVGEMSETAARNVVGRAADARKPLRILYISDFDPGGRSMPVALARKIEFILDDAGLDLDITLQPIILTPAQCEHYRLPRTPIKETERRAAKFEMRFGAGATELDALEALHPGELARVVEAEVCRYLDPTLALRIYAAERELNKHLDALHDDILDHHEVEEITERYENIRTELATLEGDAEDLWQRITDEHWALSPELQAEDLPHPRPAEPEPEPLFDSKRDYLTQIDAYRAWQGRR